MDYNFDDMGFLQMRMRFNDVKDLIDFLSKFESYKKEVNNMINSNGYTKGYVSFILKFD